MKLDYEIKTDITLSSSLDETFALFAEASNLEALTPPELQFQILTPLPIEMKQGAHIKYRLKLFGIPFNWLTEITHWEPGVRFVDEQISGPFRLWVHEHDFSAVDDSSTRIRDRVRYGLPLEPLGRLAHPIVRSRLDRIFRFREEKVHDLINEMRRSGNGNAE